MNAETVSQQKISAKGKVRGLHLTLAALFLLALVFRLWGLDYGLPHEGMTYKQITFEESKEVHRAFKLGIGEYVWGFGKGGMFWILFFEFGVYYVFSLAMGWVNDSREFATLVLEDRTTAFMIGRVTVAFMGALTCLVVYSLSKRLFNERTGLIAGAIGALSYYHVQTSTVINVDIGMVLAMWSSVLCYVCYEKSNDFRWLLGSGALAGISIAFKLPGVFTVFFIASAMLTAGGGFFTAGKIRLVAYFISALLIATTLVAPEWLLFAYDNFRGLFSAIFETGSGIASQTSNLDTQIGSITVKSTGLSFRYFELLAREHNLVLTIVALLSFCIALLRRQRWEILLGLLIIVSIGAMMLSDRSQEERYLLPLFPALWLLAARLLDEIAGYWKPLLPIGLILVLSMPSYALVRACTERMHPDTRILAKEWIEQNIPSDSRVLLDAMQHRQIVGPPLNPNTQTISKQINRAAGQIEDGKDMGRGVNDLTLSLYEESLKNAPGPSYEIHSTVHGLKVKDVEYYIERCFDYVITSSSIRIRFAQGSPYRDRFPNSATFYDQLDEHAGYDLVYQVASESWKNSGPTISVYSVSNSCANSGDQEL